MNKLTLFVSIIALSFSLAWAGDPKTIELELDGEVILSIPLDESAPVQIDAATGGLRATTTSEFSCGPDLGSCDDVEVSMASPFGSFSRSPSSVAQGAAVTFNWTSRGAWECEGLDLDGTSWVNGGKAPSGAQSVALNLDPGTYQASIRCSNGPVEDVRGPLTITVTPPDAGIPQACQGRQPAGTVRTPTCVVSSPGVISSTNCQEYSAVYGSTFPGEGQARQIATNRDTYIAMAFTMPNLPSGSSGGWSWVTPQAWPSFTGRNMQSISKCPGDFDAVKIAEEMGPHCYMKQGPLPPNGVQWALAGSGASSRCLLEPGETYYFNVFYTNSSAGTPPSQLNWQCGGDASVNVCSNNTQRVF